MKLLLDTHIALWYWGGEEKRLGRLRSFIESTLHEVFFHQVSAWEIQIKWQLGRLDLPASPASFIPEAVARTGFMYERIDDRAIYFLERLPSHHADPFDRLLISHAIIGGYTLLTADSNLSAYSVPILAP